MDRADEDGKNHLDAATRSKGLDWSEKVSVGFVIAALVTLLVFGGILSSIAFLLCAVMGWTRAMREAERQNQAKGKPTLGKTGRAIVGTVLAAFGLAFFPHDPVETSTSAGLAQPQQVAKQPVAAVPAKRDVMNPAEAKKKMADLLAGERQLDRENVEGRLMFWDDIIALDPDNAELARQHAEVKGEVDALALYREHPELGAEVIKIRPRKDGFGLVMVIDITIRNRALSHLKDFAVTCENMGSSGTVINQTSQTIYEMVPARSTETFENINMGLISPQTKSTNCRIENAVIA